jgi:Ca2+-binding EF-hand superfamily protein
MNVIRNEKNKIKQVMLAITHVDKDKSGCVTRTELDDILKDVYEELQDKNLHPFLTKFCTEQNEMLLLHKRFKEYIK